MNRSRWGQVIRAFLVLGRVSNLPTVWSNCVAGWWIAGGGPATSLIITILGVSFVYIGGMYLNDAFDYDHDKHFRPERPLPSGTIQPVVVWLTGFGWLGIGGLFLAVLGPDTAFTAVVLLGFIVFYNAVHKNTRLAPIIMAVCRFLVYVVAASAALHGITGLALWSGLALGGYITGVTYLARAETSPRLPGLWPIGLLLFPVVLAFLVNNSGHWRTLAWMLSGVVLLWIIYCLSHSWGAPAPDMGRTVAGLLAGIVWVDLLAVAGGAVWLAGLFCLLFILALLAQRFIPAT